MDNVEKVDVLDALYFFKQQYPAGFCPVLEVTAQDSDITVTNGTVTLSPASVDSDVYTFNIPAYGNWSVTANSLNITKSVNIDTCKLYSTSVKGFRYGYRIAKNESEPYARVEYLYDAVGFTPAHMDFTNGVFDYGSWADVWFVKDNKPCMLKFDGTVDYYLNPNDYSLKENGTTSDVANTSYNGNAMAQIPLCWVYRYEDEDYYYEIVSNIQWDDNYKAYAHTDANGNIKDYLYYSMFKASGSSAKTRSLSGQSFLHSLTIQQFYDATIANGSGWFPANWIQHELIRTLLILMCKSTDAQASFGNGDTRVPYSTNDFLSFGTLNDKGQFFGYNSNNQQVKVFHIEGFWGSQNTKTIGLINNAGTVFVKLTPENGGYNVTNVNGYTNTNITLPSLSSAAYITKVSCSEFGMIPIEASGGSSSTFFCDAIRTQNPQSAMYGLLTGGYDGQTTGFFRFFVLRELTYADWDRTIALSYV